MFSGLTGIELLPITIATLQNASLWFFGFVGALFLGAIALPGFWRKGMPLRDGQQINYKLSGLVLFIATHLVIAAGTVFWGWSLTPLLTHFWSLFLVVNVFAFAVTLWLFVRGRGRLGLDSARHRRGAVPPAEGETDWRLFGEDMWFGVELNPTLFGVDLKMFAYHPSLIGLAVMNAAFAYGQYEAFGVITAEMALYQAFTWAYLMTHYVREDFMLTTWDIMAERFGFMLIWGDLVYVPFLYSIVGWFVLGRGFSEGETGVIYEPLGNLALVALILFHVFFHWVFRTSNWQKDAFKRDNKVRIWGKAPQLVGGRLLISGWWGLGRKINYTGEIGVYISFALCAGFSSPYPYILPLTLVILLMQRAGRDDKRCSEKYGALWTEYCGHAKFKMFPFVY